MPFATFPEFVNLIVCNQLTTGGTMAGSVTEKNIVTLSDSNFDKEVLQSNVPVLVDFWAEWCGPCKMLGPTIDQLANEFAGKFKVGKLNVDDNMNTATR